MTDVPNVLAYRCIITISNPVPMCACDDLEQNLSLLYFLAFLEAAYFFANFWKIDLEVLF